MGITKAMGENGTDERRWLVDDGHYGNVGSQQPDLEHVAGLLVDDCTLGRFFYPNKPIWAARSYAISANLNRRNVRENSYAKQ